MLGQSSIRFLYTTAHEYLVHAPKTLRGFPGRTELLAISTGFAGCLMMVYAFTYIIIYGHAIFVEPNIMLAKIELSVFAIGGIANLAVVVKRLKH
jgi:hypothetical protein